MATGSHEGTKKTTTKKSDCDAETTHEGEGLTVVIPGQWTRNRVDEDVSVRGRKGKEPSGRIRRRYKADVGRLLRMGDKEEGLSRWNGLDQLRRFGWVFQSLGRK